MSVKIEISQDAFEHIVFLYERDELNLPFLISNGKKYVGGKDVLIADVNSAHFQDSIPVIINMCIKSNSLYEKLALSFNECIKDDMYGNKFIQNLLP